MIDFGHEITDTYDVIGEIGQGGGGIIYEAYHKRLHKKVVLKKQHESMRGLVNERTEADTLKNLRHSYLPQVLDFIVTDNAIYTVMDYIPGKSVKEVLKHEGKMSEARVIKYAKQLCDALAYLHNSKPPVIHGDIKPDNIMITPEDDVCLIDFNISSALGAANSYAFGYTLGYAAPEQRRSFEYERNRLRELDDDDKTEILSDDDRTEILDRGTAQLTVEEKIDKGILFDKRSDIYSFGATLYHMLTGIKPSPGNTHARPVLEIFPMMNRGLADIITRSMYDDPKDRFQSFDEIKKILDNIRKYDLKYKAKVTRRIITVAVLAVVIGTAVGIGLITVRNNGNKKYQSGIDEALEEYYAAEYESSIERINDLEQGFYLDLPKELESKAYYLRGNDWFELKQYEYAIEDYDTALQKDDSNLLIYRDKAIACAKLGRTGEALKVVDLAGDRGLASADLLLANAEIEAADGSKQTAIELYRECMAQTDDSQTKARAGLLCAELYDLKDAVELKEAIAVLKDAEDTDSNLRMSILERLAQCYINQAEMSGDIGGYDRALEIFTEVTDKGWDTYNTHNNMAIIYEQTGRLDEAYGQLMFMLDNYGDNYNTYKRLALLEVDRQNSFVSNDRDYSDFKEYYSKAVELYNSQNMVSDDMEMKLLDELHAQVE